MDICGRKIFCIDYNFATLLFVLFIILDEIKLYQQQNNFLNPNTYVNLRIGIWTGLAVTCKQTSGICIGLVCLAYPLLILKSKEELKRYLRIFFIRLIGILIPIGILFVYLLFTHTSADFTSYTIKGISQFSNYIPYQNLLKFNLIGILSVIVPIIIIIEWIKTIIYDKDRRLFILLLYGIAMFMIVFPIADEMHFIIGSIPIMMMLFYEIANIFKKFFKNEVFNKILFTFLTAVIILYLLYYGFTHLYIYFSKINYYATLNHFKGIPIDQNLEKEIKQVDQFILSQNKEVKILDSSAAIYMIPIDQYHKDYDMFNKGNFGENGEQRLIQDIQNSKDILYLILKENYSKNWQTPLSVIQSVKEHKSKVGEIAIFDIYE